MNFHWMKCQIYAYRIRRKNQYLGPAMAGALGLRLIFATAPPGYGP